MASESTKTSNSNHLQRNRHAALFRLRGEIDGAGLSFDLGTGLHHLGSDPANDLVLNREGVSRRHCILLVESGRIELIDQGSKNGTFADGRRIEHAVVGSRTGVAFGPAEFVLEAIDPEEAQLAFEMTPIPVDRSSPQNEPDTTANAWISFDRAERWLTLVQRTFAPVHEERTIGGALALLSLELEAPSAALCRFPVADEPEVVSAFGELRPGLVDGVRRAWRRVNDRRPARAEDFFVTHPQVTAFLAAGSAEATLGLLVTGNFDARERCLPLFRTLLRIFQAVCTCWPLGDEASVPKAAGELVFPAGYVQGSSPAMRRLHDEMGSLADSDLPVLIVGETGVGKELVAQTLHHSSNRAREPLVAINCAAIPAELLEAELFGIGDGVATGVAARRGRFQQAGGGTVFLDEIGEMPPLLQAKLLRVVQERRVEPLGAPAENVDVRLLAATNADIQGLIEQGRFRQDLFYRLAGHVLEVPPLRERREDIPMLVEHFIRAATRKTGRPVRGITVRALNALIDHDWGGNVRELGHQIWRLVHRCKPNMAIKSAMLPARTEEPPALSSTDLDPDSAIAEPSVAEGAGVQPGEEFMSLGSDLDLAAAERAMICEALRREEGNQVRAAKRLGISRYRLRRSIERYGLDQHRD